MFVKSLHPYRDFHLTIMPKRKQEEKIRYYESKIQRLRDKKVPAPIVRRRCIVYSDSSSEENNSGKLFQAITFTKVLILCTYRDTFISWVLAVSQREGNS